MILLSLHGITKGYPTGQVLSGIDWEIKSGEKIALLGRNGCGKTTLLGILSGRLAPDAGGRTAARGVRIAEMGQTPERDVSTALFGYVVAARTDILDLREQIRHLSRAVEAAPHEIGLQEKLGAAQAMLENLAGYDLERRVESILQGLGFRAEQWDQPIDSFSGGERTRIELARLLLEPVDLLLLDEPTNHLDIPAVEWLEQFLAEASCAVVLVSHDRVFLDRFAGCVVDLVDGRLETYDGNYAYYRIEQPLRRERRRKAWELQSTEIARIEDFIARNIAGQKTRQAQSRRRALAKVERLERPTGDGPAMVLGFEAERRSFRDVLDVHNYVKQIGGRRLLSGVTFTCDRGDKIGVIGPNGTGKTTLLRAVVGQDEDYTGRIRLGDRVELAYFDQHLDTLSGTGRVIDEIWEAYPYFEAGTLRSYLARFLFTGEDVFKNVADLSGGEKNRLVLARLMLTKANFLVLDEPTNHLDIAAREVLEEALAEFDGTVLVVSHDRRFLDRVATKILYVADGTVILSLGNYSDWIARRTVIETPEEKQPRDVSDAAREWQEQKRIRAEARKIARHRQELETAIAEHERRLQKTEDELADETTAHDWKRLADLSDERTRLYDELAGLYDELERLPSEEDEES